MPRSPRRARAIAAVVLIVTVAPLAPPPPATAAGECGAYESETVPPPTIRVFRTATGAVETADFRTYVKNVLSREWIASWTTESIRAGALAVKHYAWYQVVHWRGYTTMAGACFDVFDSTRDQVYDPSRPTHAPMAAAVDATWGSVALRAGRLFATYYNAGAANEPCGANENGWQLFQWGSQACGLAGRTASEIIATYYSGAVVSAPPPAQPPPSPTATPAPTAIPIPSASPAPMESRAPSPQPPSSPSAPTPTPVPATPVPTATQVPTTTPAPTPPQAPGGGQVGLAAPPPPPPPEPEPIVITVAGSGSGTIVEMTAAGEPATAERGEPDEPPLIDRLRDHPVVQFEAAVDAAEARRAAAARVATPRFAVRLLVIQLVLDRSVAGLPARVAFGS